MRARTGTRAENARLDPRLTAMDAMLLWIIFAALTAGVLAALLRPLMMQGAAAAVSSEPARSDLAVYKDQLAEIDADVARGLIAADEAENARREVQRRLLAHDQGAASVAGAVAAGGHRSIGFALTGMLPVLAIGWYLAQGTPGLPGQPHGTRAAMPLDKAPMEDLLGRVEERLKSNPGDGQGWDVIAPVYFRMQRYEDAATAYGNAVRLLGETSQRLAGFAEATVMANGGEVTDAAVATYEKLAQREPERIEPKFWLALAKEQRGKIDEAVMGYKALLASAPADAPWRPLVEERLAGIGKPAGSSAPPPSAGTAPAKGPTAEEMKAAEQLSERDRSQMIAGMVDSLAKRLQANPQDPRGWQQLVQSYVVLGDTAKAKQALADAQRHLADNSEAVGDLAALGKRLGL